MKMLALRSSARSEEVPLKTPQLLKEELVKRNLISSDVAVELEKQAASQDGAFESVLIDRKLISEDDLLKLKSEIYSLPPIKLAEINFDKDISKEISNDVMNFYQIVPFAKAGDVLKVGMVNPEDIDAREALKFIAADTNIQIERYVISLADFSTLYNNYKTLGIEVGKALESLSSQKNEEQLNLSDKVGGLEEITSEAPVSRVVAVIVKHAVDTRASDIHIEPMEDKIRLRFRIDGELQIALSLPKDLLSAIVTRIKILSDLKIDETRVPQDGRFSTRFADRTIDFRVSTFPTRNGEKVVLRILDPLVGDVKITDLGLEGYSLDLVRKNLAKPFGSILITGPTGSGKSTTLAAMLREVNDENINIITLEDPIEYYVEGVNQSQIHEEIGYTFASGLRHILRQDPDIIMVGEIRDGETAALATQAALTGHIVISTLHTNDSVGVIPRLIDMGVEKYLIAPTLNLAAAQRLVRKLCPACKQKVEPNAGEKKILLLALDKLPADLKKSWVTDKLFIYKPGNSADCKTCGGKSYKGRIAIFEAIEMNAAFERIVLGEISEEALRRESQKQGMITLYQDGMIKVLKGVTSLEEVLTAAQDYQIEEEQIKK